MSLKMIDYIVDEHNIEIDSEIQKKVKVDFCVFDNYPLIVFFPSLFLGKWSRVRLYLT